MKPRVLSQFEVWAEFCVSRKSEEEIFDFFRSEYGIAPELIAKNLHLTVYHSRRPMPTIKAVSESCHLTVDTMDLKFMVMAPGGENPRLDLIPSERKIGVRVHKKSVLRAKIYKYRNRLAIHETKRILGHRKPSSNSRNAFGARHFQPHISLLKAGTNVDDDLTIIGNAFRDSIHSINFDRFLIRVKKNF
ncbi:MAG TPA: hypothetical protein VHD83_04730 [Puia sp.]|nr:hypothetical protein [Puia sp.]